MKNSDFLDFDMLNATRSVTTRAPGNVTRLVCISGDALTFSADSAASATWAVESAGGGGSATFSGAALTPDAAGTWECSLTVAGFARRFSLIVCPATTLDVPPVKYETTSAGAPTSTTRDARVSMRILQAAANDASTNISALTTGGGTANGACNWRQFGA